MEMTNIQRLIEDQNKQNLILVHAWGTAVIKDRLAEIYHTGGVEVVRTDKGIKFPRTNQSIVVSEYIEGSFEIRFPGVANTRGITISFDEIADSSMTEVLINNLSRMARVTIKNIKNMGI